jgi:hypothetical protein
MTDFIRTRFETNPAGSTITAEAIGVLLLGAGACIVGHPELACIPAAGFAFIAPVTVRAFGDFKRSPHDDLPESVE